MPLDKSGTRPSIGRNIATEMGAGKSKKQSIAIALNVARKNGAAIPPPKKRSTMSALAGAYGGARG